MTTANQNRSKRSKVDKPIGHKHPPHDPKPNEQEAQRERDRTKLGEQALAPDREDELVVDEDRITQRTPAQRDRDAAEPMTHQPPNK